MLVAPPCRQPPDPWRGPGRTGPAQYAYHIAAPGTDNFRPVLRVPLVHDLARHRRQVPPDDKSAVLRQPCPAWPVWRQQIRVGVTRFMEMMRPKHEPPRPTPAPQLLAVIPSGTSAEETIARLTSIQAEHPPGPGYAAHGTTGRSGPLEYRTPSPSSRRVRLAMTEDGPYTQRTAGQWVVTDRLLQSMGDLMPIRRG